MGLQFNGRMMVSKTIGVGSIPARSANFFKIVFHIMVVHVVTVIGSSTKVYKVFNDIRNAKEYVYKKYDGCIEKDFTQLNNNTHEAILDDGDIIRIYTRHLEQPKIEFLQKVTIIYMKCVNEY